MKNSPRQLPSRRRQSGISLITVLILLLLSLMVVMGSFRVSNLNEAMLGSTADYNRTRAAAEALIRDAEMDINGRRPPYTTKNADGSYGLPCRPDPADSTTSLITETGYIGCRNQAAGGVPWFPKDNADFDSVSDIVFANSATKRCEAGICVPLTITDLNNIENDLANMTALGATYGQFTRNALTAPGVSGNSILTANPAKAWYWVELFRYNADMVASGVAAAAAVIPDSSKPFVFRITAVAQGLKAGTQVVLVSYFVPYPKK